ncbi:MAG TPA: MlaD family protein [Thermoleophilaceae bacterium]|nr:MlaD family protein [Thermoleophilaceae bacterium]
MSRRPAASIVASPVLVGAVTALIAIVAVFLAYNANQGLPFVPTYDLSAELHGGSNLVNGNDVQIGGRRVGLVEKIRPEVDEETGDSIAIIDMKLDKEVEPVPVDTTVKVRPRSPLGLKYVELTLGGSAESYAAGDTIPLDFATESIELEDFFSTFDEPTRNNQRIAIEGFGNAFAGRGVAINQIIQNLVPFLTHAEPVFRTLSDPDVRLDLLFTELRRFSGQIAPVADTYALLFENMATTFEALSRDPEALAQTIERSPDTLDAGIESLPIQKPFLADAEILFRRLQPVADELDRSAPILARALEVGTPVLEKAPPLYERTEGVLDALYDLAANPSTLLALQNLDDAFSVAAPLVEYIAPYQTVCNYWNYYWTSIGEHVSEPVRGGTIQRVVLRSDNRSQDNRLSDSTGERPVDIAADQPAIGATMPGLGPLETLHTHPYGPAIDAAGNADCQTGQRGYLERLITDSRYKVGELGGNHIVADSNIPGLAGPTTAGWPGVKNLKDVP